MEPIVAKIEKQNDPSHSTSKDPQLRSTDVRCCETNIQVSHCGNMSIPSKCIPLWTVSGHVPSPATSREPSLKPPHACPEPSSEPSPEPSSEMPRNPLPRQSTPCPNLHALLLALLCFCITGSLQAANGSVHFDHWPLASNKGRCGKTAFCLGILPVHFHYSTKKGIPQDKVQPRFADMIPGLVSSCLKMPKEMHRLVAPPRKKEKADSGLLRSKKPR